MIHPFVVTVVFLIIGGALSYLAYSEVRDIRRTTFAGTDERQYRSRNLTMITVSVGWLLSIIYLMMTGVSFWAALALGLVGYLVVPIYLIWPMGSPTYGAYVGLVTVLLAFGVPLTASVVLPVIIGMLVWALSELLMKPSQQPD